MKKEKIIGIINVLLISIMLLGGAYAFFDYYFEGNETVEIIAGDVYMNFVDGKDTITMSKMFPMTADAARSKDDNYITFTITGRNNTTNKDVYYEIKLLYGTTLDGRERFNDEDLRFDLEEKVGETTKRLLSNASFEEINNTKIWVNTIPSGTINNIERVYTLRMWLREDVLISDTNPNATYTTGEFSRKYASVKVEVFGDFREKEVVYEPTCSFSVLGNSQLSNSDEMIYTFVCQSPNGFTDSEITTDDIVLTGSNTATIESIVKTDIDAERKRYDIKIKNNSSTSFDLSLKENSVTDMEGVGNDVIVSETIIIDKINPVCTFDNSNKSLMLVGEEIDYTLTCTDSNGLGDSDIDISDIIINTSGLLRIRSGVPSLNNVSDLLEVTGIEKQEIANGYQYTIKLKGLADGTTTITLNDDVIKDNAGNGNLATVSNNINVDGIEPVCSFTGPNKTPIRENEETNYTLTCIDKGFKDSEITTSDILVNTSGVVSVTNIEKQQIEGGYEYNITVKSLVDGITNISLNAGAVSDTADRINETTISDNVKVDLRDMVCSFVGPEKEFIKANEVTKYTLTCEDSSFNDSDITTSDLLVNTNGIVNISGITKNQIAGGYSYEISVTGITNGTTTITLKEGVISDAAGSTNVSSTSSGITVDTVAPSCAFTGPVKTIISNSANENGKTTYTLNCTDVNGFNDSEVIASNINVNTSGIVTISSVSNKNLTSNSLSYTIEVQGAQQGETTLTLNSGVISDIAGNTNASVTSSKVTVDTTAPSCTFTGPTVTPIKKDATTTYTLTCTDNNYDTSISLTSSNLTLSSNGVISVGTPTKQTVTGGVQYIIQVTGLSDGTTTLTLPAGIIKDNAGNDNAQVTSSSITVDTAGPSCSFAGPAKTPIGVNETTTYTLTCTDVSGFNDSTIATSDVIVNTSGIVTVSSVSSGTAITNGYQYTITVKGAVAGSTTLKLNAEAVSDTLGNTNVASNDSGSIMVKEPTLYEKVETTLASYLLSDDGDARIISGGGGYNKGNPIPDPDFKNYVWYSGKLWRIVALNNDGTIKLVTQHDITNIQWGANTTFYSDDGNGNITKSWMYEWLNEDFLDTLYDPNNEIIVRNAEWDVTTTEETTKPTSPTTIEAPVGLLTAYEYTQSYSKTGSYSTGYLTNGYYWCLLTPWSSSYVQFVLISGYLSRNSSDSHSYGVRPSINLSSNIKTSGGDGSLENPYKIEGDITAPTNNVTKLNKRVSGEYVNFGGETYRIVSIENDITKITKVDYLKSGTTNVEKYLSTSIKYGSVNNSTCDGQVTYEDYYGDTHTRSCNEFWDYYLNNDWYNSISTTPINYKGMIVKGDWYLGMYPSNKSYKATICTEETINQPIKNCTKLTGNDDYGALVYNGYVGLGRVGEMFTSMIGEDSSDWTSMWTITPYSSSYVQYVDYTGFLGSYFPDWSDHGARPSINLSSNIVITGGLGTVNSPFEITLAS